MMTSTVSEHSAASEDDQYQRLLAGIRARFAEATAGAPPLFTTSATGLFDAFLAGLPANRRQHYTCHACRRFVDRFGGIVTVNDAGEVSPILWDLDVTPPFFRGAVAGVIRLVVRAKIDGVFLSTDRAWGLVSNPQTIHGPAGDTVRTWHHMAVVPAAALIFRVPAGGTLDGSIAAKREEHGMLCRGLAEFPIDIVRQAHTLLSNGQLYRSEKHAGVAKWLLDLHEMRGVTKNAAARDALTWRAAATAPVGFCHVRSGMIGTLLEDIQAGLSFADVKAKFDAKMNPLLYQRPQAAPSVGNIKAAEALVEKLGIAPSLARRFARLEDVDALWKPRAPKLEPTNGGVFAHLKPKGAAPSPMIEGPAMTMTWVKFLATVLPNAEAIEFYVPASPQSYVAMVTAVNPDAPPILQWDLPERRNPVSWYVYHNGSAPQNWNLRAGEWRKVTAVTLGPPQWYGGNFSHQGERCCFLLDDARDLRHERSGGFFPECLKSELHAVRSTLEAYAKNATIEGRDEATACGIVLAKGSTWNQRFRVTANGARTTYNLDRWD